MIMIPYMITPDVKSALAARVDKCAELAATQAAARGVSFLLKAPLFRLIDYVVFTIDTETWPWIKDHDAVRKEIDALLRQETEAWMSENEFEKHEREALRSCHGLLLDWIMALALLKMTDRVEHLEALVRADMEAENEARGVEVAVIIGTLKDALLTPLNVIPHKIKAALPAVRRFAANNAGILNQIETVSETIDAPRRDGEFLEHEVKHLILLLALDTGTVRDHVEWGTTSYCDDRGNDLSYTRD